MWQDVRREYLEQAQHRQLDSPAGRLAIRSWGTGPALYLLPGLTAPAELMCLLVWLLRTDYRCVTVELDRSDDSGNRTAGPATLEADVTRLIAAADVLGDQQFSLFGADVGAACGLLSASRFPQRVDRLVLLQGFLRRRVSFLERQLARWCAWSRQPLAKFPRREFLQMQNHRRWFPPFDGTRWQYFLDASGTMPLREIGRRGLAVAKFDLRSAAARISAPTLIIRTEGDGQIADACNSELLRVLPRASEEWLHNTGQLAYLTHPHRLAKLIKAFVVKHAEAGLV